MFRAPTWVEGTCLASGHLREVWAPLELEHPWDGGTQLAYRHPPARTPACTVPQAAVTWQDWGRCWPDWHSGTGCRAPGTLSSGAPRGSHVHR